MMNSPPDSVASFASMPRRWQAAVAALALPGAGVSGGLGAVGAGPRGVVGGVGQSGGMFTGRLAGAPGTVSPDPCSVNRTPRFRRPSRWEMRCAPSSSSSSSSSSSPSISSSSSSSILTVGGGLVPIPTSARPTPPSPGPSVGPSPSSVGPSSLSCGAVGGVSL
eukprot:scaffold88325_cov108-Phaeocystis_antarctica.AAC.1